MPTTTSAEQNKSLQWLMKTFTEEVPDTDSATLASTEGLLIATAGFLDQDAADKVCAVVSGLYSLGGAASKFQKNPSKAPPQQVSVQLDGGFLFLMLAGQGSLLAVQTGLRADPGVVGHEMSLLVKRVEQNLSTPLRESDVSAAGA